MNLHLVGGFLGSGKTTAIIGAARLLMAQGKRVGVVTNDQGKYLVDTAFFKFADIPAVEVTGGCFCCNYDVLENRLNDLVEMTQPDIIFAESVGSCADIVATVIKPLVTLKNKPSDFTSLSVFTDARLLKARLLDQDLPFSDDVVYIFDKQIEEAGVIIINKIDLLPESGRQEIKNLTQERYPDKNILLQNSLDELNIKRWIRGLENESIYSPLKSLDLDYARYGAGESRLAWLDKRLSIEVTPGKGRRAVISLIKVMLSELNKQKIPVGHLKFYIQADGDAVKISIPTIFEELWEDKIPLFPNARFVEVLINGRVETEATFFDNLIQNVVLDFSTTDGASIMVLETASFHPQYPKPIHRIQ
jgi:Ni2+-binding GTPase involved in maturation of urease and hydrogenase